VKTSRSDNRSYSGILRRHVAWTSGTARTAAWRTDVADGDQEVATAPERSSVPQLRNWSAYMSPLTEFEIHLSADS
jgi:hypothetical protein